MSNLDKYNEVFLSLFNSKDVTSLKYGSNGWDSAGHLILITELEKIFDIKLELEEVLNFKSYKHGIPILKNHGIGI